MVEALSKFPTPKNRTDVRSLQGLVQQFEAFDPEISQLMIPLRSLNSSRTSFVWEETHEQAFQKLKQGHLETFRSYWQLHLHSSCL